MSSNSKSENQVLTGRQAVRLRPGMYIGSTEQRGLHHLIYAALDNSVEEGLSGSCSRIEVVLRPDHEVLVRDNSAGLPVDVEPDLGRSKLDLILSTWWYPQPAFGQVHGGLHGLGLVVVNMLSSVFSAEVARDGYLWRQDYTEGIANGSVERVRPLDSTEPTGTTITFRPDFTIFTPHPFIYDVIARRCSDAAYHVAGLTVQLRDERDTAGRMSTFLAEHGLKTLVSSLIQDFSFSEYDPFWGRYQLTIPRKGQDPFRLGVETAFAFTYTNKNVELSYVNTVETPDGGTHIAALRSAILKVLNDKRGKHPRLNWSHVAPGFVGIISIRHPNPHFASPTKIILHDPDILNAVKTAIAEDFAQYVDQYPAAVSRFTRR